MARIFWALIILAISTFSASAERRLALVFGSGEYRSMRKLDNAVNDARLIERSLSELGFEVSLETNRDLKRMRRALDDFRQDAAGADVTLVYFAGHGVEISGDNRLLPVDADISSLDSFRASTLPLEEIRDAIASISKVGLVLLDACRNDPFGIVDEAGRGAKAVQQKLKEAVRPGLGRVGRADNILFGFAAAPGQVASDGDGDNSPFTTALSRHVGTEGLEIRSVLTLVQQEVYAASKGAQLPYVESGLPKVFFAADTGYVLSERERLLLAMAELTPALRSEVEQTAARNDVPLAPLYGSLLSANLASLTPVDRSNKLEEAARAYSEVQIRFKALGAADPAVMRLRSEAETSLEQGSFAEARLKLSQAAAIDATSSEELAKNLLERRLSEAETHLADAGIARTQLDRVAVDAALARAAALHAWIRREITASTISDDDLMRRISRSLFMLGWAEQAQWNLMAARLHLQESLDISKRLVDRDPSSAEARLAVIDAMAKISVNQLNSGDISGSIETSRLIIDEHTALTRQFPENTRFLFSLAKAHYDLSKVAKYRQQHLKEALKVLQRMKDVGVLGEREWLLKSVTDKLAELDMGHDRK
nr:caspase domain-containing protein [Oryzicola mucosus]